MKTYKLFAGLYIKNYKAKEIAELEFESENDALQAAFEAACDLYESADFADKVYWDDIAEDENLDPIKDEEYINGIYFEVRDDFLDYYIEEIE